MVEARSTSSRHSLYYLCLAILFGAGTFYFVSWPISGQTDNDIWYHLNGGRHFFEQKAIAASGFFSFLAADRTWTNYYWLFQVIVYGIYDVAGYFGLILFRTAMFLVTLFCVARLLLSRATGAFPSRPGFEGGFPDRRSAEERTRDTRAAWKRFLGQPNGTHGQGDRPPTGPTGRVFGYFTVLVILYFLALQPRYLFFLRPHMFSYLFIVLFLLVLEDRRQRHLKWLPLLGVLWSNLHGVEYPVMLLLCLAYLPEMLHAEWHKGSAAGRLLRMPLVFLISTMLTVVLNPFGIDLFLSPFLSAPHQFLYIEELGRLTFSDLLVFDFTSTTAIFQSLSNLILLGASAGLVASLSRGRLRLSHLVLLAGGLYLLLGRGERFRYEAMLLALPLLRANPLFIPGLRRRRAAATGGEAMAVLLTVGAVIFLHAAYTPRPRHPVSTATSPDRAAVFLNQLPARGPVLNHPNHGGFLQWRLDSRYPIAMDLEMMLFTDADFFLVNNAFLDPTVFSRFYARYRPPFLMPLISNRRIAAVTRDSADYVPIFFDNAVAVYVDRQQYPEIADRYRLRAAVPERLRDLNLRDLSGEQVSALLTELERLRRLDPRIVLVNQALVQVHRRRGELDQAASLAEEIIHWQPESPVGHYLLAEVLFDRQAYPAALSRYHAVLARDDRPAWPNFWRRVSFCHVKAGDFARAYEALRKEVRPFAWRSTSRDLYRLARLALASGRRGEGIMLLRFAHMKTPQEETAFRARIMALLDHLESGNPVVPAP